jgi:tetratricopeptide (TPR) repeat protein
MSEQEAVLFLLRRAGLLSPTAPLTDANPADQRDASALVETLGYLPLALDQAGAYLDETRESISNYLTLYQQHRATLLHRRGGIDADHASVATTWTLAFERLTQSNPAALELIRLCAFLAPDAIPEEVFTKEIEEIEETPELSPILRTFTTNRLAFNDALAVLCNYGLINRDPTTHTLSIHRLVQAVIQDELDESQQIAWATRAIQAIHTLFPFDEPGPWLQSQRLFPHALVCLDHRQHWNMTFFEARNLITKVGAYLQNRGQYAEAEQIYQEVLAIYKKVFGDEHPNTAGGLNNLATLYVDQGKYEQAEPLHQQALIIRKKMQGDKHPNMVTSLNNLAELYRYQGKYEQAEPLYQEALAICKKVLGDDHEDTAQILHNLAALYNGHGKYEQAEPLYQEALAIHQKVLGDDHPNTAKTLHNLAILYRQQGKYKEAEHLYQGVLAIRRKVLGDEHPDTASTLNNLAVLYQKQGKYDEAERLYQEALAIRKKMLGDEHPETKRTMNNYAELQQEMQKHKRKRKR